MIDHLDPWTRNIRPVLPEQAVQAFRAWLASQEPGAPPRLGAHCLLDGRFLFERGEGR